MNGGRDTDVTERLTTRRGAAKAAAVALGLLLAAATVALVPQAQRAQAAEGTGAFQAQAPAQAEAKKPSLTLSDTEAGTGGSITVTGKGWRPRTLLTLLICGQNAIGGTNSCANSQGRAATTSAGGSFEKKLPVAEPPKPCPCVVRAATVTGDYAAADTEFRVAGHPVKPLPEDTGGGGRLTVLAARLEGGGGLLNWFGAPPQRRLVLTVGNLGAARARNPVFEVGTAHGVFAPEWERQQWRGTVDPGEKARVKLPVELSAGAHGEYTVAAKYGGKVLTEQPWDVGRPWGVTLFWILLLLVVPAAVFRICMTVLDRTRPRQAGQVVSGRERKRAARPSLPSALSAWLTDRLPAPAPDSGSGPGEGGHTANGDGRGADSPGSSLPWFSPDAPPLPRGTGESRHPGHPKISAPSDDRPPSKGST